MDVEVKLASVSVREVSEKPMSLVRMRVFYVSPSSAILVKVYDGSIIIGSRGLTKTSRRAFVIVVKSILGSRQHK